jgi:hypothetical protein
MEEGSELGIRVDLPVCFDVRRFCALLVTMTSARAEVDELTETDERVEEGSECLEVVMKMDEW